MDGKNISSNRNVWLIPRSLITDMTLTSWEFLAAAYMLKTSVNSDDVLMNKTYMSMYIYKEETSAYAEKCLWDAVISLEKKGYIRKKYNIRKYIFYDVTSLKDRYWDHMIDEGGYVRIYDYELETIMTLDTSHSKASVLRYFTYIISGMYCGNDVKEHLYGKFCYRTSRNTIEAFNEQISSRTISAYNDVLEENNLIYVLRSEQPVKYLDMAGKASIRMRPNIYCRPEDKDHIREFAKTKAGWYQKKY